MVSMHLFWGKKTETKEHSYYFARAEKENNSSNLKALLGL